MLLNKTTMYYDDCRRPSGTWIALNRFARLPFPAHVQLYDYVVMVAHGQLYFAGGESRETSVNNQGDLVCFEEYSSCLDVFFQYDVPSNKWQSLRSMLVARKAFTMVALDNCLYAIGGSDQQGNVLLDVERYDMSKKTWVPIAHLLEAVRCLSSVAYNGKILVCGTQESMQHTPMDNRYRYFGDMIIQLYDPTKNIWHRVYKIAYPLNWQAYSTVLTVYDGVCYRVCYECSMWHTNRPRVHRLVCDFHSEVPAVGIGEGQDQSCIPVENGLKGFCISNSVFINIHGVITKLDVEVTEDKLIDFSRWLRINEHSRGIASFTFDKRLLGADVQEKGLPATRDT